MTDTKFTPGPWSVESPKGWASLCITAPSRDGLSERPLATMTKPKAYFTDFPTRIDANGEKWTVCSNPAAEKAGNYVATEEIKEEIDAQQKRDAHLIAAAPELYEALKQAREHVHLAWLREGDNSNRAEIALKAVDAALAKARGES